MVLSPSIFPPSSISMFSYFRPLSRPVFSPCCCPCIPYLFFSSTHTTYCFGYPDVKFPKLHSSPSVRSLGDGGEDELSKTGTVDAWEDFWWTGYRAIVM